MNLPQTTTVDYDPREKNILIFDSGVGGLSVYQQIQAQLPQLNYYYLFDNEAYPYGELEPEYLIQRVLALVVEFVEKESIDLVVIACNTASTIVLPTLRAKLTIPVVGVVPAIKPASLISTKALGLIATPATVKRQYTHDLIKHFAHQQVKLLGSTRLVDIVEEKLRGKTVSLDEIRAIVAPLKNEIDVAVLGCTHFPLIREELQIALGKEITIIDSGAAIAQRVKSLLASEVSLDKSRIKREHVIFCSAPPWEESALNERLKEFHFTPVHQYWFQGALDR